MQIDLIGGSYENRYKDWNSQRCVNWFPKMADGKESDKTQKMLVPRPGLSQHANCTGDAVRGLFTARTRTQERLFAVVGTALYEIFYDGSTASIGALTGMATGSRSKVYMALNGAGELMLQDTMAAYIFDLDTNLLTKISSIDYNAATTLDYADGYFIVSGQDGRVHFSDLNDGFTWPGLNFFTPTFKPDGVRAVVASREEIYCFGDETIEVYINDGSTPFIRQSRTSMYYGLTARDSVSVHQAGVFFLGKSSMGGSEVYMMGQNYAVTPISSPAISQRLNAAGSLEDAEGFVMNSKDGHIFYHLHLPALETTLVYDVTTQLWHERQSRRPFPYSNGSTADDMFRGRCFATFKGMNLFGDWHSGKIFKEDSTVATDDLLVRLLKRTSSVFHNERKYISVYSLEFDMNAGQSAKTTGQGSAPVMTLRYSIDGGNTFEPEEMIALGNLGEYDYRVQTHNMGTARDWVISFEISDPLDIVVMQAEVHGAYGAY
jgi:hypothetical protein